MKQTAFLQKLIAKAQQDIQTIVLPEGEDERILKAARAIAEMKAAKLVILGNEAEIKAYFAANGWNMDNIEIVEPEKSAKLQQYAEMFYEMRKDKGISMEDAVKQMNNYNYFGTMMIKAGDADGMVSGANHSTADTVRPALQIIKSTKKGRSVSSAVVIVSNDKPYIFSDCAIIIDPTSQELADIAVDAAQTAIQFGIEPKVAMLSFSTKGSAKGEKVEKVTEAVKLAQQQLELPEYKKLGIKLDGELQLDAAIDGVVAAKKAPNSEVAGQANVLVFPDINAGNIGYKLCQRIGGAEAYGPILQGLNAPVNDLSRGALVEDIIGMIAITCLQAQK
uniref:Phosphate acetyltransferase n=1 Tax=uncultured Alphaproteobacteria bacterium TaxID=91750 RepID=A0A6G8F1Z7_9PROT|nr:phosphate acetyltransferase [uncultured Alphaproteobacteria bacterium]